MEQAFDISIDSAESYFDHNGIAVFAGTGDVGYDNDDSSPNYPATSAYVFAVGGTSLSPAGNTRGWTETAWGAKQVSPDGAGGSACSTAIAKPSWQTSTACSRRMTSDIAAVGDPETGPAMYDVNVGGWVQGGGTSAATPLAAAIFAATGNGNRTPQFAYQSSTAFFDVTSGTNANGTGCTGVLCNAGPGWDGPTGIGTPNGAALAALGSDDSGSGSVAAGGDDTSNGGCSAAGDSGAATIVFALGLTLVRRRRVA